MQRPYSLTLMRTDLAVLERFFDKNDFAIVTGELNVQRDRLLRAVVVKADPFTLQRRQTHNGSLCWLW